MQPLHSTLKYFGMQKELEKGSKDRKYGTASVREVMRLEPSNER